MGVLTISVRGSFPRDIPQSRRFSAQENGHTRAVREAIAYLKHEVLPKAIACDAALLAAGEHPSEGFLERDLAWLSSHGKSSGAQIPTIEECMRDVAGMIDGALPPGWGFFAVVCSLTPKGSTETGHMSYIATIDRAQVPAVCRELIGMLESGNPGTIGKEIE